jgi:uncharacterized membrane-anchored protein
MGTSLTTDTNQATPENTATVLYCANHPGRETMLRCNRCNKPICYDCAMLTPVGYRCKECVRGQQAKYYNGSTLDPFIGAVIGFILGALAGVAACLFLGLFGILGFFIALFAGPAAGGVIAEGVRWSVRRRRARYLNVFVIIATLAGMFLAGLFLLGPRAIGSLLPVLLFAIGMASTIYARLQ